MYRVAILASHVIQYQDPFFRLLARQKEIDLTVFYCSRAGAEMYRDADMRTTLRWDIETLTGYRHVFLRNFGFGDGYTRLINPGVVPAILRGHFDAVILFLGWGTISSLLAIAACRASQTPFFLYGDSSFPPPEIIAKDRVRAGFIRTIFGLAGGFMTSGVLNAEYYRHYGGDPRTFHLLPWAVDNERFEKNSRFAPDEREAMRAKYGLRADELVIIFSAKLVARKDPMTLLRALAAMRHRDRAAAVFLGNGALREALESFAAAHALHAVFAGFINQTDLPKHYAMGDVFVLPSVYEPRGAVINEAMACGLPVIVTDRCGSIGDVVQKGENAFLYPTGDAAALARHLDHLIDDPALRERMARRSRQIIATWDFARGVEGVKEALRVSPAAQRRAGSEVDVAIPGLTPGATGDTEVASRTTLATGASGNGHRATGNAAGIERSPGRKPGDHDASTTNEPAAPSAGGTRALTIAIPTYNRGSILVETIEHLLALDPRASEILIVDQTLDHPREIAATLEQWNRDGAIRWLRLPEPSIPHAMNVALLEATSAHVLFLDDDIIPPRDLVRAHAAAHTGGDVWAVVGQVLQPGEQPGHFDDATLRRGPLRDLEFRFNHDEPCDVENVMAGNLSVDRTRALSIGAFDENFLFAAYRFETDFARRVIAAGGRIRYEPSASIRHLKAATGGVRAHGDHRGSASPAHPVGDYYFARLHVPAFWRYVAHRLVKNVITRHHLRRPLLLPFKLAGELRGLLLGLRLARNGRRLYRGE